MPSRDRFGKEFGPPPTERAIILLLLALIVTFWIVSAFSAVKAAEPEAKPKLLYVYTSPQHCQPCRRLDKALAYPPMNAFQVIRLTPPPDTSYPCIYWRDAQGDWQHYMGWGKNGEAEFLAAYRKSGRVL